VISLGFRPEPLTIRLSARAGFAAALLVDPGPWPDGVSIALVFGPDDEPGVTWPATIDGNEARWSRTQAEVAAVLALTGDPDVTLLFTGADDVELPWGHGKVVRV
jgi:hypothetical protein